MSDSERVSSLESTRPRRWQRFVKAPVLLAVVGLTAVVGSALLIGYYQAVNQRISRLEKETAPKLVTTAPSPAPDAQPVATNKTELAQKTRSSTALLSTRRPRVARAAVARIRRQPRNAAKESEVARRTESSQPVNKKDPILTAMLKTTWRVLKKPFTF